MGILLRQEINLSFYNIGEFLQEGELVIQETQMTRKGSSEKDVVNCIPETQMPPPIHDSRWSSDKNTVQYNKINKV